MRAAAVTEREIARVLREKSRANGAPSRQRRAIRKGKLKMRYGADPMAEIIRTQEKLELLCELERERYAVRHDR